MRFTKQKAIDIIESNNLSTKTLQVWKSRGFIPDRYKHHQPERLDHNEKKVKVLRKALESKYFHVIHFNTWSGKYHQYWDFMRRKRKISIEVMYTALAEIKDLRRLGIKAKQNCTQEDYRNFFFDKRIITSKLLNDREQARIRHSPNHINHEEMKEKVLKFLENTKTS